MTRSVLSLSALPALPVILEAVLHPVNLALWLGKYARVYHDSGRSGQSTAPCVGASRVRTQLGARNFVRDCVFSFVNPLPNTLQSSYTSDVSSSELALDSRLRQLANRLGRWTRFRPCSSERVSMAYPNHTPHQAFLPIADSILDSHVLETLRTRFARTTLHLAHFTRQRD